MKNPSKNLNTLWGFNLYAKTARRMSHGDDHYGTSCKKKRKLLCDYGLTCFCLIMFGKNWDEKYGFFSFRILNQRLKEGIRLKKKVWSIGGGFIIQTKEKKFEKFQPRRGYLNEKP